MHDILEQAARPEQRVRLGSLLAGIGQRRGMTAEERRAFEAAIERDKDDARPLSFDR